MLLTLWLIITLGLAARCIYLELKVSRQNTKEGTPSTSTNNARDAITPLVVDAVNTDGGHHKQWYLEAIAEALQIALPPHDDGIAP